MVRTKQLSEDDTPATPPLSCGTGRIGGELATSTAAQKRGKAGRRTLPLSSLSFLVVSEKKEKRLGLDARWRAMVLRKEM